MNWYKSITKQSAKVDNNHPQISNKRREEDFFFAAMRKHETSYNLTIVHREIDNRDNDPYWSVHISGISFELGNIIYKRNLFFKDYKTSLIQYNKAVKLLHELRQESEANNIPTATLPSRIWYTLHDVVGDEDLKSRSSANILYLRQDHNINENKGNLFNNIIYLKNADYAVVEKDPIGLENKLMSPC